MATAVTMDREYQPMNEDAQRALQQCLTQLCDKMKTTELLVFMRSKYAFTSGEVQEIEVKFQINQYEFIFYMFVILTFQAKSTQYKTNKELIIILQAKSQKAFDTFIQSLWYTGQKHLAEEVLKLIDRNYAAQLLKLCQPQCSKANATQEEDIKKFVYIFFFNLVLSLIIYSLIRIH